MAFGVSDRDRIVFQGGASVETHALAHIEGQSEVGPAQLEIRLFLGFDDLNMN